MVVGTLLFVICIGSLLPAPDPMVWSAGSLPKRRRLVHAVRNLALLPGPPATWLGDWVAGPFVVVCNDDIAQWPYSPSLFG